MNEEVENILTNWEYQARERDVRDPLRRQILDEATLIRKTIEDQEDEIRRLRAIFRVNMLRLVPDISHRDIDILLGQESA